MSKNTISDHETWLLQYTLYSRKLQLITLYVDPLYTTQPSVYICVVHEKNAKKNTIRSILIKLFVSFITQRDICESK